jgi:hypothetical protein
MCGFQCISPSLKLTVILLVNVVPFIEQLCIQKK